jgi:4-amino-4-deoxy-L-arabinose transferase-like glycosyltransferase
MLPLAASERTATQIALLITGVTLWRAAVAWALPVTQDEAYYFDWARHLSWGYFDHPPGVALLALGSTLAPASAIAGRLGNLIAATLTLVVLARFYRRCTLPGQARVLALVIVAATLPGLGVGVIATPDTGLALCWALALHEALAALQGNRRRWLGAGLAVGLGLLAKYPMVLIGPVLLWAIARADPRALRTPWPYLGGVVALIVFLPHLHWNASNDWVTMRFQLGHGFASETGPLLPHDLPEAVRMASSGADGPKTAGDRLASIGRYAGGQLALWGLLLVPFAVALGRRRPADTEPVGAGTDARALPLLWAGALFPLLFFSLTAAFGSPEANWPAMYLMSAAPLAALALRHVGGWVWAGAAGNALLISLYALHAATAALPIGDWGNRILRETHGYQALAERVRALPGPVFADAYQTTAMLRFYQPQLAVTQWPGVTRPSEYLRGVIAKPVALAEIRSAGGFWLVGRRSAPPDIPGFRAADIVSLVDCLGEDLAEVAASTPPCASPLRRWQIVRYVPAAETRRPEEPDQRSSSTYFAPQ